MSAWLWLMIAILFEVAGTTCLKLSSGLTKLLPALLTVLFYCISFATLAFTLKRMEVSLVYALWAGLGTALIALIGILYFGESISWFKILSLLFIVAGVIGLNLSRSAH